MSLNLKTYTEHFTNPLYLESGRILEPYDIAYETYGELNDDKSNVIVICHALTGSHHCAGTYESDKKAGWWDSFIGSGKAVDTDRYFVICTNVIGSCFGSTGPMSLQHPHHDPYRYKFPVITIKDMVKAQKILFDKLGIHHVYAIIGGSMGGMQTLEWTLLGKHLVKSAVVIGCGARHSAWQIGFGETQRLAIYNDPKWNNGDIDFK